MEKKRNLWGFIMCCLFVFVCCLIMIPYKCIKSFFTMCCEVYDDSLDNAPIIYGGEKAKDSIVGDKIHK